METSLTAVDIWIEKKKGWDTVNNIFLIYNLQNTKLEPIAHSLKNRHQTDRTLVTKLIDFALSCPYIGRSMRKTILVPRINEITYLIHIPKYPPALGVKCIDGHSFVTPNTPRSKTPFGSPKTIPSVVSFQFSLPRPELKEK